MKRAVSTSIGGHLVSAIMGGLTALAIKRHFAAWHGDLSSITPDGFISAAALPVAVFGAIFFLAHLILRHGLITPRISYPLAGAVALSAAAAAGMPMELAQRALDDGILSVLLAVAAGMGSIIGFLHVRSAGFEFDETESEVLAQHVRSPSRVERTTERGSDMSSGLTQNAELGLVQTHEDEFYDGPLQVATSTNAIVSATVVGALVHTIYTFVATVGFSSGSDSASRRMAEQFANGELFSAFAFTILFSAIVCAIVLPPAIYGLHKFLHVRGKLDAVSYVKYGAIAPIALGLAFFIVGIFMTHWFILPLAVGMGVYRNLAGLEPADLPEDIEVRDRRALVTSDHVRRRVHRIVS